MWFWKSKRIKEAEEALEFCKTAIEDAIYTEDGLDGSIGEYVINMLIDYYRKYRPDLFRKHQEMIERTNKADLI